MSLDLYSYDKSNIFAKILKGDIPCGRKFYEDDFILAFEDINKIAPIHILVIPKKPFTSFADFSAKSTTEEVGYFFKIVNQIAQEQTNGQYRIVSNIGSEASQIIPHFHIHITSGKKLKNL